MKSNTSKLVENLYKSFLSTMALVSCAVTPEDQIPCRDSATDQEIVLSKEIVRDKWSTYLSPTQIAFTEKSSRIEFYQCGGMIYVMLTQLPYILDEFGRKQYIVDGFDQILEVVDLANARVL